MKRDMSCPPGDCEILSIRHCAGSKRTPTEFLYDQAVPAIEIRTYADGTVWESRSKFTCWGGYIPDGWVCIHDPRPPLEGPDECTLEDCFAVFGEAATYRALQGFRNSPLHREQPSPLQLFVAMKWAGDRYDSSFKYARTFGVSLDEVSSRDSVKIDDVDWCEVKGDRKVMVSR